MLAVRSELSERILAARASELLHLLGQPTLFHLPGRRLEPLFVSVLLHGNEDVGWLAVRKVLQAHADHGLPRAMSLFVGNVAAAHVYQRRLEGQPDYNRVWPGAEVDSTPEHAMMRQIVTDLAARRVFASVDLHNNTGRNPLYACVNLTDPATLHLASLFSNTVVFFERPKGVQSMAFARLCPAVTCECGRVGDPFGVEHAADFLDACLHIAEIPQHPVPSGDLHLFRTVAIVSVPRSVSFGFGSEETRDLQLSPELEDWNFQELLPGTVFGRARSGTDANLRICDMNNRDVTSEYLNVNSGKITLSKVVIPAMLTLNHRVVEQDCLGYLMERYPNEALDQSGGSE